MKLPYKMNETIKSALAQVYPNVDDLSYSTLFIRGLKDENDDLKEGFMTPRYITFYSTDKNKVIMATELANRLLSENFDFDLSDTGPLCPSEEVQDAIYLHRRSRAIGAETFIEFASNALNKDELAPCFDFLLKSNFCLEIIEHDAIGDSAKSYSAKTYLRPSTADITADTGVLVYPSVMEAVEKVLTSEHCHYEEVIDFNFDTCFIESKLFKGEIPPPETLEEFITLVRKNLLALKK